MCQNEKSDKICSNLSKLPKPPNWAIPYPLLVLISTSKNVSEWKIRTYNLKNLSEKNPDETTFKLCKIWLKCKSLEIWNTYYRIKLNLQSYFLAIIWPHYIQDLGKQLFWKVFNCHNINFSLPAFQLTERYSHLLNIRAKHLRLARSRNIDFLAAHTWRLWL